jgi:hypothetical protein
MKTAEDLISEYAGEEFIDNEHIMGIVRKAVKIAKMIPLPDSKFTEVWGEIYEAILVYSMDKADNSIDLPLSKAEKASIAKVRSCLYLLRGELAAPPGENGNVHMYYMSMRSTLFKHDPIEYLDKLILTETHPKHRTDGEQKRRAAESAFGVLSGLGQRTSTTRKSLFCKLSAAIYGTPNEDFHHVCRDYKRSRKPKAQNQEN